MGKNRKRKRCLPEQRYNNNNNTSPTADEDVNGKGSGVLDSEEYGIDQISQEDLDITISTLERISALKPSSIFAKRFKLLRKAMHPLAVQQLQTYQHGTDYRIKVTQFLSIQHWADALAALKGCRDFGQIPKQGTIQRWVRDCDPCTAPCKLQLLNAILTLANPSTNTTSDNKGIGNVDSMSSMALDDDDSPSMDTYMNIHDPRHAILALQQHGQMSEEDTFPNESTTRPSMPEDSGIEIMPDWSIGRLMTTTERCNNNDNDNNNTGNDDEIGSSNSEIIDWNHLPTVSLQSRILYREIAAERTPPNHYDLLLHTNDNACIEWSESPPSIIKHHIPFFQSEKTADLFLLENVLTVKECQQLRAAATQLGWRPDHPTQLEQPTGINSCEWLVNDSIVSVISDRVRPHLPHLDRNNRDATSSSSISKNAIVEDPLPSPPSSSSSPVIRFHSINPRWRFFRYGPHCVYRPHIDGSWPASRIDANGQYECYSQGADGSTTIKSYHTFLIYLNDNFEGGQTRFYVPKTYSTGTTTTTSNATNAAGGGGGTLIAHGITPKCGSVLVFSQGNTASLLHEGSAVTKGQKFVIRTDILYETRSGNRNLVLNSSKGKKDGPQMVRRTFGIGMNESRLF